MSRLLLCLIAGAVLAAGCGSDDEGEGAAGRTEAAVSGETRADESGAAGGGEESSTARADEPSAAGDDEAAAAGEAAPADGAQPARRRGPLLKLRDSQFGPVLFNGHDRALYLFTRDPKRMTRCYGACAAAWPPFYAKGRPRAGRGVDRDLIGTIERRDGRRQVTYKGQPLYFYVHDPKGQVLCNDIVEFGGTWYAVDADGNPPA